MIKFAPNLFFMYREHAPLDRFAAARADGFSHVELCYLDDLDVGEVRRAADDAGQAILSFNFPPGRVEPGVWRGLSGIPGHEGEIPALMEQGLEWGAALGAGMALAPLVGLRPDGVPLEDCERVFIENLKAALPRLETAGFTLLIEPHCSKDFPGYILDRVGQCRRIIEAVGSPHVRLLLDTYHTQRMEGDMIRRFAGNLDIIAHLQAGNPPDRHEPDIGELNHLAYFRAVAASAYDGFVAGEYFPAGDTSEGLAWMERMGVPRI